MADVKTEAPPAKKPPKRSPGGAPEFGPQRKMTSGGILALVIKVVLLGIIDALAVFGLYVLVGKGDWVAAALLVAVVALINYIYLKPGVLPAKYLTPGLFFLAIFQVFVILYTGYISFTNYGDAHNSTKDDAIAQIIRTSQERVPDSPAYAVEIYKQADQFGMLVAEPGGGTAFGTNEQPLEDASSAPDGWEKLNLNQVLRFQDEVLALNVQVTDDINDGTLRTPDGTTAFVFTSTLEYDEASDTFTNTETGVTYADDGEGNFRAEDGQTLTPGWRVVIGWDNYAYAFTSEQIRDPLIRVTIWTFAFAALSTLLCFALGLFLAIVFNHPTLRGKKIYRILVILPYAFPVYLTGLVWAGMLNQEFGFVNDVLLGGANIPWLSDPWLARLSVLLVNMWLGYAYMFLVCTGALQSLPDDVVEAAKMDGAGAWRTFRSIKLPLLFVAVAPLLIATFAYNFNNFGVIFMLTGGNPRFPDTTLPIGATDIMLTMVYKIAFGSGGGRDYGLASALSILIFIVVAIIAAVSFRSTKSLEDLH